MNRRLFLSSLLAASGMKVIPKAEAQPQPERYKVAKYERGVNLEPPLKIGDRVVIDIKVPGFGLPENTQQVDIEASRPAIEVTCHDSSGFQQYIPGPIAYTWITFTVGWSAELYWEYKADFTQLVDGKPEYEITGMATVCHT